MNMSYPHEDRMTADMLDALPDVYYIQQEILDADANAHAARKAGSIDLPATSYSGKPVTHGTRNVMYALEKYWITRRDITRDLLELAMGIDNAREWLYNNNISSFRGKL